ncbi:MAG: LPS export ABC transporter permease LptG [Gammaproteobacteria bacterium]
MIAARYIAGNFFSAAGLVLLLLLALFSFLELAEALEDVGQGNYTTADAVAIVVLTTPTRIIELLPVTVLLGSIVGLGVMANNRELLALRAVGLSAWRLTAILAVIGATIAAVAMAMQLFLVPPCERQAQEFRARTLDESPLGGAEFWSRRGASLLRVGRVDFGRIPRELEIYTLGPDGTLDSLMLADRADILDARRWRLHDVVEKRIEPEQILVRRSESLVWKSFLNPDQLGALIAPAQSLSAIDLYQYLDASAGAGLDTREQQAQLWQQVSQPLALLAMILLGLPLVLGAVRTRSAGFRSTIGAAIGIGFYLAEQITSRLAVLLELEPATTALAPAVLLLTVAILAIKRTA